MDADALIRSQAERIIQLEAEKISKSGQTNYCLQCEQAGKKIEALEMIIEEGLRNLPSTDAWLEWQRRAWSCLHAGARLK